MELVDQLEEAILHGRRSRLGGGYSVDRDRLLELIDQMRAAAPEAIAEAQRVLEERDKILNDAGEEAELTLAKARQEAEIRVNAHDLVLEAQRRATDVIEQANSRARTISGDARAEAAGLRGEAASQAVGQAVEADRYSLEVLRQLETQLQLMIASIQAGMEELERKLEHEQEQHAVDVRDAELQRE